MPANMRGSRHYPDKSFVNLGDSFSMGQQNQGESPLTRYTRVGHYGGQSFNQNMPPIPQVDHI